LRALSGFCVTGKSNDWVNVLDVVTLPTFLCSEKARFMSGSVFVFPEIQHKECDIRNEAFETVST
jgi:hypothetical protein